MQGGPAKRQAALAALSLAVAGSSGCMNRGGQGACKTYDACAVVTAADVSAAMGKKFVAGAESNPGATLAAPLAKSAICRYATDKTTDPFVAVLLRCCPCGDNDPDAAAQSFGGAAMTVTPIAGIGDSAIWVAMNPDAGVPAIDQLIVYVDADFQIVVSIAVPLGEPFAVDPQMAAERIAATALSRQ